MNISPIRTRGRAATTETTSDALFRPALLSYSHLFSILLFPVYWIAVVAFEVEGEFYHYPPVFWTSHFDFQNFVRGLAIFGGTQALIASLVVELANPVLVVGFGMLLACSMGRFNAAGNNMNFFVLSLLFAPPVVATMPLFIIWKDA